MLPLRRPWGAMLGLNCRSSVVFPQPDGPQSVSGAYVRKHVGALPPEFTDDYFTNFGVNYSHILRIDRHLPWTDPNCVRILDAVQPKYLTHELSSGPNRPQLAAVKRQLGTIRKGYTK